MRPHSYGPAAEAPVTSLARLSCARSNPAASPDDRLLRKGLPVRTGSKTLVCSAAPVLMAALVVAGCGSSKKSTTATTFDVSATESGKTVKYSAPSSVNGGLVKEVFLNHGKQPHVGQLIRIEGNHSVQDALKVLVSNSNKTPEWLRAEGGAEIGVPG